MCGFTGYLTFPSRLQAGLPTRLRQATALMRHRGPDQSGEFFDDTGAVGMGFARLSIIDLSERGRQPMGNEDCNLQLTFNGEIYNYIELREELKKYGHQFRSETDSEVLLHLYEQYGLNMLNKLDGMYAFVIYDLKKQEIFAARDRFGKKPFYYAYTPSGFYWASEFRALVHLVPEELHEDLQGFYHYVTFNCYPREYTFYQEIRKLLPGHALRFGLHMTKLKIQRYYRLDLHKNSDSYGERDERLRMLFASAVKKRLMSDVPIGFYLSGGIDSSAIVMQASQFHSSIYTFSIGLEGDPAELDETAYARLVARRFGTKHYETKITEREFVENILEVAWALDEPVNLPDAGLLNHLTKAASVLGVKVLMSGEGGDEVLFGYTNYMHYIRKYYQYIAFYRYLHAGVRDIAKAALRAVAPQEFDSLHRWLRGRERFLGGNLGLSDVQKHRYLAKRVVQDSNICEWSDALSVRLQRQLRVKAEEHLSKQIMLNEFNIRLPDLLMMRIDKVTMANSVEARNPFLDRDLVEYASGIPFEDLYDGKLGKVALRRALKNLLPAEILTRGKMGFGASLEGRPKPLIADLLREIITDCSFLRDYFNPEYLNSLVAPPREQNYAAYYSRWNVLIFALWKQRLDTRVSARLSI